MVCICWLTLFLFYCMDPVLIVSLIINLCLIAERAMKYYLKHVRKSQCCGSVMETREPSPENDLEKVVI